MNRRLKKIIYGFFYLVILSAIAFVAGRPFFSPNPSCLDGIMNQEEEGIDCGAVCGRECLPDNLEELYPSLTRTFGINEDRLTFLAEIKNPNQDFAASSFSYRVEFYEERDEPLGVITGQSLVPNGGVNYIVLPNLPLPKSNLIRADLKITSTNWVSAESFSTPALTLSDLKTEIIFNQIKVTGKIKNLERIKQENVDIIAIFKNKSDHSIGASITSLESIEGLKILPFTIFHPLIEGIDLLSTQVVISQGLSNL